MATQAQTAGGGAPAGSGGAGMDAHAMPKITPEMIDAAATIAGITLTDEQKKMMLEGLGQQRDSVAVIRTMKIPNSVAPAFVFDPVPAGMVLDTVTEADADQHGSGCEGARGDGFGWSWREIRMRWRLLRCASWRSW